MPDTASTRPLYAPILIGAALVALGASVILGWLLQIPELVRIAPGFAAMAFNAALCFVLMGAALMFSGVAPAWRTRAQVLLSGLTVALAALVLSQDLFDIDIGIDRLFSADWLQDESQLHTRMAPNTALAFILSGTTLILLNLGRGRWLGYAAKYLALIVGLIGLTGLLGHILKLEFLFAWYPYARMAVHTASGIVLLGIGLWVCWQCAKNKIGQADTPDTRIVFTGSVILVVMALTAGIVSFLMLVEQTEVTLKRGLQTSLLNRVEVYGDSLNSAVVNARDITLRPAIQRELQRWNATPGHPEALDFLRRAISSYIGLGMSAVALDDASGRRVTEAGTFARVPALRVPLNLPHRPELLWENGMVLRTRIPVIVDKQIIGTVIAEQRLPLLTRMFDNVRGLGESGEMVLCATRGDRIFCFPTRLRPEVFTVSRRIQGKLLPIAFALDGFQGVSQMTDYRGQRVIAAHSPISQTGLGMVMKMNVEELYQPIHRQFQQMLFLLLALTVVGIVLLRWQVLPLARRLVVAEGEAREREQHLHAIMENATDAIITINEAGLIESFNAAASRTFGYPKGQVIGQNIQMLMPEALRVAHAAGLRRYLENGEKHVVGKGPVEMQGRRQDGSEFPLELGINEVRLGNKRLFIGIMRDITERKQAEQTIRELSLTDELTDLRNRRGFVTLAEAELALARRVQRSLLLFYVDLDGMKHINDTLGHTAGDQALRDVAKLLRNTFRESDIVARLGGDEFAVLAIEDAQGDASQALRGNGEDYTDTIIRRLQSNVEVLNETAGRSYRLALSVGVVRCEAGSRLALDELMAEADAAMYRVKEGRRAKGNVGR